MFSPQSLEESSSLQKSFNIGIETFLKETVLRESIPSFLTMYISKWLEHLLLSALKICWQGKKQVRIIFFYCEAPREKAVPELTVKPTFWALELLKEKKMDYSEIQWKSELSDPW